jgi:hypothetical protein
MSIRLLSKAFRRGGMHHKAALDIEALRISAAMAHIKALGNLDGFPAGRSERLALVSTAGRQGLVVWDKSRGRYELTSLGEGRLGDLRTLVSDSSRADRVIGQDSVRSQMKPRLLGTVGGAAACAGLIAWLFLGSSPSPALQASGNSVTVPPAAASPLPAPTEVTSSEQSALSEKEPSSLIGRAGTEDQAGQFGQSSSVDTSGESQTLAAVAEKRVSKKRGDTVQSRKLAHSQKKTGRKARPADPDEGFGPSFTIGRLLGVERGPTLGFVEDDRRNGGRATQQGSPPSWFFR